MLFSSVAAFIGIAASLAPSALAWGGPATHDVQVGPNGQLVFDPMTLEANVATKRLRNGARHQPRCTRDEQLVPGLPGHCARYWGRAQGGGGRDSGGMLLGWLHTRRSSRRLQLHKRLGIND
ncbi:hypothetical protein EVG20_g2686 [Dentipellis fragilis]|uniref:Uncharacterized protein n=1 Tax=Dentipellis fragilis TaxID=205917 RepID=A0A4Y9Z923_9AGAM|nr:hypothetical protein EVG20_g2686 [Dentipellis fragilis]